MQAPLEAGIDRALASIMHIAIRSGRERTMGIDSESDVTADLQIGPTSLGAVRLFVAAGDMEIPMDFTPEEAEEIAEELRVAAAAARKVKPRRRS